MKRVTKKSIIKVYKTISLLTVLMGAMTINVCSKSWYQPNVPEGFEDFIRREIKKK